MRGTLLGRVFAGRAGAAGASGVPLDVGRASFDYLPVLDGFRAISILLVVFSHAGLENIIPGGLGVIVFFVISGFLITRQIVAEITATGKLSFGAFYLRRFFRLAPALLLYLAMFTSLFVLLGAHTTGWQIASGIFYVANYYHIFIGYPPLNPNPILWSLSIEEHFYLVAPFVIFLFRRRLANLLPCLVLLLAAVPLWRLYLFESCAHDPSWGMCGLPGGLRIFHGTDTMFDCIAYGCALALALHFHGEKLRRVMSRPVVAWSALAALFATLLVRNPAFRDTIRYSIQAGSVAVIAAAMLYGRWPLAARLLSTPPALLVGRLSYSLYLFHFGVSGLVTRLIPGPLLSPLSLTLFLTGSFAFASLSYFFVERPMVAVRKRFSAARFSRPSPKTVTPGADSSVIYSPGPRINTREAAEITKP